MIRREGKKWVLRAKKSGKVLGRHPTRGDAERQEQAIKARQAASKGR